MCQVLCQGPLGTLCVILPTPRGRDFFKLLMQEIELIIPLG